MRQPLYPAVTVHTVVAIGLCDQFSGNSPGFPDRIAFSYTTRDNYNFTREVHPQVSYCSVRVSISSGTGAALIVEGGLPRNDPARYIPGRPDG